MERTVLIRYGEISLKSEPVRKKFENILIDNIKASLEETQIKILRERGRIFIETKKPKKVASRTAKLPGIVSTSPTHQTKPTMKKIRKKSREIIEKSFPETGTFAIRARRAGKHPFTSKEIEEKVGTDTLEIKPDLTVNLDSPDHKLHIEVRKEKGYLFTEIIPGTGGLPVGSQEGVIVPFINDVGSNIVSTYLLLKRGSHANPLFFKSEENSSTRYLRIVEELEKFHPNLEFCILPVQNIVEEINENIPKKFQEIIQERILLKIGEKVANKLGAEALVRGEDLEEITDLSLHNLEIIQDEISIPVLYPLLGFDKEKNQETRKMIRKFGEENSIKFGFNSFEKEKMNGKKISNIEKRIPKDSLIESAVKSLEISKVGD